MNISTRQFELILDRLREAFFDLEGVLKFLNHELEREKRLGGLEEEKK